MWLVIGLEEYDGIFDPYYYLKVLFKARRQYLGPVNLVWMIYLLVCKEKINNWAWFHYHCCGHICINQMYM
jgi:hypothetical protein